MENSYIPKDYYQKLIRNWFFLPFAMIIGGLIGLFLHYFIPPIFEAQAKFVVSIDYTRTGYLSDIQEDQAMRGIGSLIDSDFVHQKTVDKVNSLGEKISLSEIKEKSRLERGEFEWYIRIRDRKAENASKLVNLWAEQADQVLIDAIQHSLKAEGLFNYLDSIELCLQRISLGLDSLPPCDAKNTNEILKEMNSVGILAYQEKEASRGLMPALTVELREKSVLPLQPVVFARNGFVFGGAIIGMMAMLIWLAFKKTKQTVKNTRTRDLG
jgi:hypothetical protein